MRILFCGGLGCGGAEHQMVLIAKHFSLLGYEVFFLTDDVNAFYGEELKKSKMQIVNYPKRTLAVSLKLVIPYHILFLLDFIKKNRIDIGVSFLAEYNFANCMAAMLMHGKYKAITGLRNARESLMLSKRECFYARFEKYASFKVCNSDNAKNMYAKYFPLCVNKLTTIYNIVHLPKIISSYDIRQGGKTHFIVPASYREVKNPYGLLDALSLMTEKEMELFDITWYGETYNGTLPYYVKLKEEVNRRNLSRVFKLKNATIDIASRMNEADVVALFSSSEGLPNAICEGMMLGKPILMTRVSDYDVLSKGNGFLCDWDDSQSIKEAILQMASSSNKKLLDMGEVSLEKANSLFSEKSSVGKWKVLIEDLLK